MKKLKTVLLIAVISISVSASIANLPQPYCLQQEQYFKISSPWGYYYCPAGRLGIDYMCEYSPASTCTYYKPTGNEVYIPCQSGQFMPWYTW